MLRFTIIGQVVDLDTGVPLPGLFIKAYDKDLLFDDLLGTAASDAQGRFEIAAEPEDFREFFDKRPDIYFKVFRGQTLVHDTDDAVRWGAGRVSEFVIRVPGERFHVAGESGITLAGDDGEPRSEYGVGESLTLQAAGLRPVHVYETTVLLDGREMFTSSFITNQHGELEPSVAWPQMGLYDPAGEARYTPREAQERWAGRRLSLVLADGGEPIAEQAFVLSDALSAPVVIGSEADGRLNNGFEAGAEPLHVTLWNLPFRGPARVYVVPRQHDWRVGDPIAPTALADGRPAVREVEVGEGETVVRLAEAEELLPGAFDFIVRPVRYGWEEDDAPRLLRTDVVGGRRVTGIVIRERFWTAKPVLGGCVNKLPLSGRLVSGAPYFRYGDTFTVGENVYAGMDPGIVDPANISKRCALYVINSKNGAAWANNSLAHLAVLGGNGATQKHTLQPGCMNMNRVLVWPAASQPGNYDIVADFGNNTGDPMAFVADDQYNTPLDIIDGYFDTGFRVVEDPGTMSNFTHVGNWNYTQPSVNVQDEMNQYHAPGAFIAGNVAVARNAHVFFPADMAGVTNPMQISAAQADYPLIVIIHGNGHSYTSYDWLLQHLARNGFIAAAIHLNGGMGALGRANVFFQHLPLLQAAFGARMQNNIGIMGHSRGGEAVIKAARLNQQLGLGHNLNAIISLAPTDQYGSEVLGGAWAKPYFVLYGSRDGDIDGGIWVNGYTVPMTGFAQYDRANGARKSMAFVHRATHNGFITTNYEADPGDAMDCLDPALQKPITAAYMNAFFRWHLRAEPQWEGMFTGEWKPGSVESLGVQMYLQYRHPNPRTVDDFEGAAPNWQASSIGGTVAHGGTLPANPGEGKLHDHPAAVGIDPKSPHDSKGLRLRWDNLGDRLDFTIPPAQKDVTAYTTLSLRVSQVVDGVGNPLNQAQNFRVGLKDGSNNAREVRVSAFGTVPFPDHRFDHALSKSAMCTIRIPLVSYTIVCAGMVQVDLADVTTLSLVFSETATGDIDIDEIEFTL